MIFVDFKNRSEAEAFKHKDTRARPLTYLENGGVFIRDSSIVLLSIGIG